MTEIEIDVNDRKNFNLLKGNEFTKVIIKETISADHPWNVFLEARAKALVWYREKRPEETDDMIAHMFSVDAYQVSNIIKYQRKIEESDGLVHERK